MSKLNSFHECKSIVTLCQIPYPVSQMSFLLMKTKKNHDLHDVKA